MLKRSVAWRRLSFHLSVSLPVTSYQLSSIQITSLVNTARSGPPGDSGLGHAVALEAEKQGSARWRERSIVAEYSYCLVQNLVGSG